MYNKKKYFTNIAVAILIYCILIFLIRTKILGNYHIKIIDIILINIILTSSLNLTVGNLGQLTLGHAGFMAIGAYTSAIITTYLTLPPYLLFPFAIFISGLLAMIVAFFIGIPALRLKGDYLAIITLGFGQIIKDLINNAKITNGAKGYKNIKPFFDDYKINIFVNFTVLFFVCALTVLIISNLLETRHGRAIISIREDEIASEASGINTTYYKIFAFSFSAFFAGVAGALYAHHSGLLGANKFDYNYSIEMVIMVVFAGLFVKTGKMTSLIISAIVLTFLPELLSDYAKYRMLIYSIILILVMLYKDHIFVLANKITAKIKKQVR